MSKTISMGHTGQSFFKKAAILMQPSWISGLLCALFALAVTGTVIGVQLYRGSVIQQEYLAWHAPRSAEAAYEAAFTLQYGTTTWQTVTGDLFTGLFWSFVAALIYLIIFSIYDAFHVTEEFEAEMHYVNNNRQTLVRSVIQRIVARVVVAAIWFCFVLLFFRTVVPDGLTAAHIAAVRRSSLAGLGYAFAAIVGLSIAAHVHVVFLRLLLLRLRTFHNKAY